VAGMNGCGQLIGIIGRSGHWMDQIQFVFDQQPIENVFMVPIEIDIKSAFDKYQEIINSQIKYQEIEGTESKEDQINEETTLNNDLNNNDEELKDQESIMIQSLSSLNFVQSNIESVCLFGKNIDELGKAKLNLGE
jgi:hypothetical protein